MGDITKEFELLTDWVDFMVRQVAFKYDFHVRDVRQYPKNARTSTHVLLLNQGEMPVNHGWGELKDCDVAVGEIQLRRFGGGWNTTFESFKNPRKISYVPVEPPTLRDSDIEWVRKYSSRQQSGMNGFGL